MGKMKALLEEVPCFCTTCKKVTQQDVWHETMVDDKVITHWRCSECGQEDTNA